MFLNIIKNSIEAIPYGGLITISVTIKNNQVLTSIKDNGIGMTEEQVNKIGQPFYTTKDDGNGLGLMVSYKIIEKHKGRITIESEPNKGTEFLISFPLFTKNRT
ncbi:ATP-binding protein [Heyndrickxia sporothermodurans]|uniref:ATP-binding protein n=1 Tax=Heyndrickxia sporothermodurans TaxID=46224 RepID=UPI0015E69D7E|nr:ATP-binding protein [Heyndrickxia sporothermodurans]